MKSNRFWIIILGMVILASVAVAAVIRQSPVSQASVYQNGALIETFNLTAITEPYSFEVSCEIGCNVITVEYGRICVSDADCPDKACVRQGWISGGIIPIVCLPHRLLIEFERIGTPEIDALVR